VTVLLWAALVVAVVVSCIVVEDIWPLRVLVWILEAIADSKSDGGGYSGGGGGRSGGGGGDSSF
jgi:hypothetical protein